MQQFYGGGGMRRNSVRRELQANRYDATTDTLVWTDGQVQGLRGAAAAL